MALVVLACIAIRTGGFAAAALARNQPIGIPLLYAVPLAGIAIGLLFVLFDRVPAFLTGRGSGPAVARGAA
jgi:hypothetical protein